MLALYRHAMLVRGEGVRRDPRWITLTILAGVALLSLWLSVF